MNSSSYRNVFWFIKCHKESNRCISESTFKNFKQVSDETGNHQNLLTSHLKGDKGSAALSGKNIKVLDLGQRIYRQKKMVPSSVSESPEVVHPDVDLVLVLLIAATVK